MKNVKITGVSETNKLYNKIGQIVRREDIVVLKAGKRMLSEAYIINVKGIGEIRLEPSLFEEFNEIVPALNNSIAGMLAAIWGGKKWNGKIYRDVAYIDGEKITLTPENMKLLINKPYPNEVGAKEVTKYKDLSAKYGVSDSTFCEVTEWELNEESFKTVSHDY